jgi:hypothetical protein
MADPVQIPIPPEVQDYIDAIQDSGLANPILKIDGQTGAIGCPNEVLYCLRAINQFCAGSSITVTQSNGVITKITLSNANMNSTDNTTLKGLLDEAIDGYDGDQTYIS